METRSIALVGRPNVGKSRLFNRLTGKRLAIVHDQPGVTRDVMLQEVDNDYILMDTGGIGMKQTPMTSAEIQQATEDAVDFALQAASLVLFVVDAKDGLTPLDQEVAAHLRSYNKPVALVINKLDAKNAESEIDAFYRLGFNDTVAVSAEHGSNIDTLKELISSTLGPKPESSEIEIPNQGRLRMCFAGRPNVGKSSLTNKLLKADRLIVSNVPGTTRDAIHSELDYDAPDGTRWKFELIDTAGLRPKTKVDSSLEYFSGVRTNHSINNSDVVFLVLDANEGLTRHEKRLAAQVIEEGKGLVLVINKWDQVLERFREDPPAGYESEADFKMAYTKALRQELFQLPDSPIIYTSARDNYNIDEILRRAKGLFDRMGKKLSTSKINKLLNDLFERQKPRSVHGKRFKIYYATQVSNFPYKIKVFCNSKERLDDTYLRYIEGEFVKAFQLRGCPVKFEFVGKPKRS